ncbi:hypothetical protein [Streptomyces sp. B15]|uniref:hypothetical protein n=1 Tax=Streptomyces sp. B15 TaxID=1537797 RepID=UPI001B37D438|nr:hypothetical protein [Streptomyces sp. B15]MBQ1122604.1 hypothetical protein [Streptomyces sp. B15]
MALQLTGLGPGDVAEVVESLIVAADACEPTAPELADARRELAHRIGDALDTLPAAVPPREDTPPMSDTTTETPYTDEDLRTEAARQHYELTTDPEFMCVGEAMEDAEVDSLAPQHAGQDVDGQPNDADGVTWAGLLPFEADDGDAYNAAQRKVHDLISGAADVSRWAVDLGADGLQPEDHAISLDGDDTPLVRVHMAFHPDMSDADRQRFAMRLGQLVANAL